MTNFFGAPHESPIEIYDALVENSDESWIMGLLAFAILEENKFEWMKHHKLYNGSYPDEEKIKEWYKQQPKSILMKVKDEAFIKLKDYSDEIILEEIESKKEDIKDGIIVQEIKASNKFWPQFGVNLAGGLISSFVFSLLLASLAFILFNDASPATLVNSKKQSTNNIINPIALSADSPIQKEQE